MSLNPSPAEQLDRLLVYIGENQGSLADEPQVHNNQCYEAVGLIKSGNDRYYEMVWLLEQGENSNLFSVNRTLGSTYCRLTLIGWQRYDAIKRGRVEGRSVLMAMKFGDPALDRVVESCFKPAVKRAGFELRTIVENQPAGLIDDQLRVALRISRFVIADLTHRNNGAYWEAGFAEGLGRPVIYTCREAEWNLGGSHFDTNHLVTIIWKDDELAKAGAQLTGTIRATLPSEAVMTD